MHDTKKPFIVNDKVFTANSRTRAGWLALAKFLTIGQLIKLQQEQERANAECWQNKI